MNATNLIGYMAATVGTILMLPQVIRSYRTKRVTDISGLMVAMYLLNCALWAMYGFLLHSGPVVLCNLLGLLIGVAQAVLKIRHSR